jgi:hypothetical protein
MKSLFALLTVLTLSSCSLLLDAVSISNRRAKQVTKGEILEGDGFRLRAPTSGLFPIANDPTRGGITLRNCDPLFDNGPSFVTPFSPTGTRSLDNGLNQWFNVPQSKGCKTVILHKRATEFMGLPAIQATFEIGNGSSTQAGALLIIERLNDFLILQCVQKFNHPSQRQQVVTRVERQLLELQRSTVITKR